MRHSKLLWCHIACCCVVCSASARYSAPILTLLQVPSTGATAAGAVCFCVLRCALCIVRFALCLLCLRSALCALRLAHCALRCATCAALRLRCAINVCTSLSALQRQCNSELLRRIVALLLIYVMLVVASDERSATWNSNSEVWK